MQMDLPHTLFNFKKEKIGGSKKAKVQVRVNPNDPAFALAQAAYEKALAKRKAQMEGKEPYRMEELFR